jgi:hypothetical protein
LPTPKDTIELSGASLVPEAFPDRSEIYWSPSDIKPGDQERFYLYTPFTAGWKYFTINKQVRLSEAYPEDYERDIGYAFNHGPGKTDREGKPMEEKAKPRSIWIAKGWHVERKMLMVLVIDSANVQQRIAKALKHNPDFGILRSGVSNFFVTVFREADPKKPSDTYDAMLQLRVTQAKPILEAAAAPWNPDRFWKGLNPLEEGPEPPAEGKGAQPPVTSRDEHGADTMAEVPVEEEQEEEEPW